MHPHNYPKIIDEATFQRCQEVRLGYNKKPIVYAAKPFIFRGLIQCGHCGGLYTSEIKKGKYIYLSCPKSHKHECPAPRLKEEQVFSQLVDVFDNMAFPPQIMEEIRVHLADSHKSKQEFHNSSVNSMRKEYDQIQKKLDILLDALLAQSISQSEYDIKARELKQRQYEINQQQNNLDGADEDFSISLQLVLELVNNAGRLFRSSKIEQKRKLLTLVFQNLTLTHGKAQFSLRKPFELFLNQANCTEWRPLQDSNLRPTD